MSESNQEHPQWCIDAAETITGNKYGDRNVFIPTNYGDKSTMGIADIIYRKWKETSHV